MRSDRAHPREIDELDALWDSLNQEAPSSPSLPDPSDDSALSIAHLQSLAAQEFDTPTAGGSRDRVRARFDALVGKDAPMSSAHAPTIPARNRPRPARRRVLHSHHLTTTSVFGRLAAAILLVIVLASAIVIGPGRGMLPSEFEHQLAALPGFETSKPSDQKPQGDRSLMSIRLIPGEAPTGKIDVGLWRVVLGPGTTLNVPDEIQSLGQDPVAQFVESGSITLGGQGKQFTATADRNMGIQAVEHYRNESDQPAEMLLLAPLGESGTFPLVASSNDDQATPVSSSGVEATLLGTNTVSEDDGYQIRVTLSTLHYADTLDPKVYRAGSPVYAVIETGEITVNRTATDGTPASSEVFGAGETIRLDGNRRLNATFTETGSEPLSALIVETAPMSDNPTLDQTQKAAAPLFIDWTVPEPGDVTLTLRALTIEPGGAYAMPTDAGVSYAVIEGSINLSVDGGDTATIETGAVVGQEPGTTLAFANTGTGPARLIQSVVSASDDVTNWRSEQSTNTEKQIVVTARETLPAGPASIMLQQQEYAGDNSARQTSLAGNGVTLAIAAEGTIAVSRIGGDVQIASSSPSPASPQAGTPAISQVPSDGTPDVNTAQPSLGESMPISAGDGYMLAHPGGGWSMSGHGESPSIGIALTVSPNDVGNATPEAMSRTPASDGPTITLRGDAAACSIEPLTADRLDQIMATPVAETSPLDRSLKNQPGGSADAATTDTITATLQWYVDCTATGDYTRIYAFYSDQALRENESAIDLVERDWQVGERPVQASVEDIVRFADGRAGARAVIDGEATYLTFVQEDGVWKIDVWDDTGD